MRRPKLSSTWFIFGLGAHLQVVASLSFSEIFVLLFGPYLLMTDQVQLKHHGLNRFIFLSFLVVIGCGIACLANHSDFQQSLRGFAVTVLITLSIPVAHYLLRKDPQGIGWYFIGMAISNILSTFIFQRPVEVNMYAQGQAGAAATEAIMSGPIFWISQLSSWVSLWPRGWYLSCPGWYCVIAPLFMSGFSMLTSSSGRSAALGALGSVAIFLIGGKKIRTMKRFGKHFILLLICAVVGIVAAKSLYKHAALEGWLGEQSRNKYLSQTHAGDGVLQLLMGGRAESFVGLFACLDKPIIGYGPWAIDYHGYYEDFLAKYGNAEDYAQYMAQSGKNSKLKLIAAHSHIIGFWLWYGVYGLVYWLYIIYVLIRYIRQDCHAVPQWFYWLACGIPGAFWGIFFSPFAGRVTFPLMVTACLMARAVRKGQQQMPFSMIREIEKVKAKER